MRIRNSNALFSIATALGVLVCLFTAVPASAQSKFRHDTPIDSLMGGPKEHIDSLYWLVLDSLGSCVYTAKKADEAGDIEKAVDYNRRAYAIWQLAFFQAPVSDIVYQKGVYDDALGVLCYLIMHEPQLPIREAYYHDLITLFKTRLANLDDLNAVHFNRQRSEGYIKMLQACYTYYYGIWTYRGTDRRIDLEQAYSRFVEAMRALMEARKRDIKSVEDEMDYLRGEDSRLIPHYAVEQFIRLSELHYQSNPEQQRLSFLQDYIDCTDLCESILETAESLQMNPKRLKRLQQNYESVLGVCDQLLVASGAADSAVVVPLFDPQVETGRDNLAFLRRTMSLFEACDLTHTDTYIKAAEYAFALCPSFHDAVITASHYAEVGDVERSTRRYNEALDLTSNPRQRGKVALLVARALMSAGRFDEAVAACDRAQEFAGEYARICQKMKQRIVELQNLVRVSRQQQAEYEKAQRRRQEEEDFWTKGKQP